MSGSSDPRSDYFGGDALCDVHPLGMLPIFPALFVKLLC